MYAYCLSGDGRKQVAELWDIDPRAVHRQINSVTLPHAVMVNEAMDAMKLEGDLEVKIGSSLICDAKCIIGHKIVYLEVDRTYGSLKEKAKRYSKVAPSTLIVVTKREKQAAKYFSDLNHEVIIVHVDMLSDPDLSKKIESAIKEE